MNLDSYDNHALYDAAIKLANDIQVYEGKSSRYVNILELMKIVLYLDIARNLNDIADNADGILVREFTGKSEDEGIV